MRALVLLSLLSLPLAGCETFDFFEKSETKSETKREYKYCNIPARYRVFRTSPEICRQLGGHFVDESKVDQLQSYYESLNAD